jgi:hypothetical protein
MRHEARRLSERIYPYDLEAELYRQATLLFGVNWGALLAS